MVIRTTSTQQMAFTLPEPVRTWTPPDDWTTPTSLPELHGIVALDFETKDPGITRGTGSSWAIKDEGFICGAAFAWEGGLGYAPVAHAAGNMDPMLFWTWLRKQSMKPDVTFVMANSVYDSGWLARHDITPVNSPYDVQAMAYLLNEHRRSYSLSNLSKDYLGEDKSTVALAAAAKAAHISAPMSNMDKMPAWMVTPYALTDATLTLKLYHHLLPLLEAEDLLRAHELERECAMVAVDMRRIGVRIDMDRVAQVKTRFIARRDAALRQVQELVGIPISATDNDSHARALMIENAGVQLGTTATGKVSVAKGVLQQINSPVANAILTARKYEKAIGTFITGYFESFVVNGRAHCEFHPTKNSTDNDSEFAEIEGGTGTYRFSSSNFNFQNIPARDPDIGPDIRGCCVPEEDCEWAKLDYASQEPRLGVHFAAGVDIKKEWIDDINAHIFNSNQKLRPGPLPGAQEMRQRFIDDPRTDLHGECAALMNVKRGPAKIINLAIWYGAQGANISHQLGLPTKTITTRRGTQIEVAGAEAQALLDKHFEALPFIRGFFEFARWSAEERGYVRALDGHRLRFEKYADGNYVQTYKACNKIIQGSAAVQMKMALVALRRAGLPSNLTVHDESNRSVPLGEAGEREKRMLIDIMESAAPISVPMIAELKTGASWGEIE